MNVNGEKYYFGDYIISKNKSIFLYDIAKQSKKGKLPKVFQSKSYTSVQLAKDDISKYLETKGV